MDAIAQELLKKAEAVQGLFAEGKAEYDEAYGIGTWQQAVLTGVDSLEATDYGYSISLKFNLTGDDKPFSNRLALPRTLQANGHDVEAWQTKKEDDKRAVLNRGLAAVGYNHIVNGNIDTQEQYDAIVAVFSAHVGENCPLRVKADGKNVKNAEGKWTFEPNGFTKIDFLRRKKGK